MEYIKSIISLMKIASITDIIDILLVAFLIYKLMTLLKDTSAERLIKGIIVIIVAMQTLRLANLNTIGYILDQTYYFGMFAVIVIFQPELRRVLEQVGKGKLVQKIVANKAQFDKSENAISQITAACENMSWTRTGALIVIERDEKLGEIAKTGTMIDAETSSELIKNIFYPKSPLHDGAMIVRDSRILSAGCVLPLSGSQTISKELGTRHRAAIGMSETSDAVLVVVSEETGSISVAVGGMLKRHLAPETLEKVLRAELKVDEVLEPTKTPKKSRFPKWKGKKQ